VLNRSRFQDTNKWTIVAYAGLTIGLIGVVLSVLAWLLH
jgi:hypothetical protein